MSWRTIDIAEVRLTPAEKAAFANIQNSESVGAEVLTNVVGEFRDTIAAAGTAISESTGTIPDQVRLHVINRTRWLWLCEFPALKNFQTDARKDLNTAAEKMLADISAGKVKVPPGDGSAVDQSPSPAFGTRGGSAANDPPEREFTKDKQEGI